MTYEILRQTWLTQRPHKTAQSWVVFSSALLVVGCSIFWHNFLGLGEVMPASANQVYAHHEYWRLWTTLFAHADIGHLIANSLLFVILGYFLNGYFGPILFPIGALLCGGLTNAISIATYPPDLELIGASGVVAWMGGAWLILYVKLNRQIMMQARILRASGVAILLFAPSEAFDPHISYRTHLIGFVLGLASGAIYYQKNKIKLHRKDLYEYVTEEDQPENEEAIIQN